MDDGDFSGTKLGSVTPVETGPPGTVTSVEIWQPRPMTSGYSHVGGDRDGFWAE